MEEQAIDKCSAVGDPAIFGECLSVIEWSHYRSWCEYDMCSRQDATDDTSMCLVLSVMARDCAEHGIHIQWNHLCPGEKSVCRLMIVKIATVKTRYNTVSYKRRKL